MKTISRLLKNLIHKNRETQFIAKITKITGYAWAAVKFEFGLITGSYFFCISGLYTLAVGFSKGIFFKGKKEREINSESERKNYLKMCGILTIASVIYISYMARLFFFPSKISFNMYFSIFIAAFAFTELTLALIGLIKTYGKNDLLLNGLKCVNLASAFMAIVFTQVALLSFAAPEQEVSKYNAIGGILFGIACLSICVYMLVKYFSAKKAYPVVL